MNLYHVTLRRIQHAHAIPHLMVEVSVRTSYPVQATDVIATIERRWKAPWCVVGIEKTL